MYLVNAEFPNDITGLVDGDAVMYKFDANDPRDT